MRRGKSGIQACCSVKEVERELERVALRYRRAGDDLLLASGMSPDEVRALEGMERAFALDGLGREVRANRLRGRGPTWKRFLATAEDYRDALEAVKRVRGPTRKERGR